MGCFSSTPTSAKYELKTKPASQNILPTHPLQPKPQQSPQILRQIKYIPKQTLNFPIFLPRDFLPKNISLQVALINGKNKDLTADMSITGLQLKKTIYHSLSKELNPQSMSLYYQKIKITNKMSLKDLKIPSRVGFKVKITQRKVQLKEVKGLIVNPEAEDQLTLQIGVAKMKCGHYIGRDSIIQHIYSIISKKKYEIRCPYQKPNLQTCQAIWDYEHCKKVGVFTKTQRKKIENGLRLNLLNKDMKSCPKCNATVSKLDLDTNHVQCPSCETEFCYKCLGLWRASDQSIQCGNKQCNGFEKLLSSCPWDKSFTLFDQKGNGKLYFTPKYRACVHCSEVIQHQQLCKHMKCQMCQNSFCWVCLAIPEESLNGLWYPCGDSDEYCGRVAGVQQLY